MRKSSCTLASVALLALVLALPARADVILDWNALYVDLIREELINPPLASQEMAMMNVAIYDAVIGIAGGFESYADHGPAPAGASMEAAAAAAAHHVLVTRYPSHKAELDAAYRQVVPAGPVPPAISAGASWGVQVAVRILAQRASDGANDVRDYLSASGAGWWVPTLPNFAPALLPHWGSLKPWTMRSGDQFRGEAPPPLTSAEYAANFDEVYRLGRLDSTERTPDQTEIAKFWDDSAGTSSPPGHWSWMMQIVSAQEGLSLVENARLFALLSLASADAGIVAWDMKFHYGHWRPITGIQNADQDGNPATTADPSWQSLLNTPPFPAYTSGHSTFSGASGRVVALFFGRDDIAFSVPSDGVPGVLRHFESFSAAANEAARSRIYGGIHWHHDDEVGVETGRRLGSHVFYNYLRPLDDGPETCNPAAGHLCLQDGRFAVQASWRTQDGQEGVGTPGALSDDSGTFWFFNQDNVELTVKVLDGCAAFDRYWVFASGLTNVEVVLTVTDTSTGKSRNYLNPMGEAFEAIQDTDAFATCQ
ncbi:MAG TPA: vanadium-dependent haloperoxidase [Thermoanaerobaculia bacterium]|nr:vanadium-dependent haloperoxidase [Thermoanaerobaculia bacterium]